MSLEDGVANHYARGDRASAILAAQGGGQGSGPPEHRRPRPGGRVPRPRQATVELGEKLGLQPDMKVLDVGCGIGGASRYLAATYGCQVAMPFEDAAFDAAYTQHVAMNIADKPGLYAEIARVLKPGAVFGIYDLLQGVGGEVVFPVPWAREPSRAARRCWDCTCCCRTSGRSPRTF